MDVAAIEADLLDQSMQLFGADRGAIFLHEQDGATIVHRSCGLSAAYLAQIPSLAAGSWLRSLIDAGQPTAFPRWGADANDPDRQRHRREAIAEGFLSVASAPLMADGMAQGALVLYHDRARRYGTRDLERLRLLGEKAGVAVRNARDYAQMARWAAQLSSIQQLGVRLSRLGSVGEVGDAIADELQELIDYHNVRVYRLVNQEELVPVSVRGRVGEYVDETREQLVTRVGVGLTGWVAEHRQALLVHDAAHDLRGTTIPGTHAGLEESMLLAPMLFEGEVLGVLVLSKLGLRQFTPDDLRLLEIYASFAAQAMANVDATERLREQYAQMARWAAQLRSIQQLGVRLSRLSTVREIGNAIAGELRELIDYHNVRVYRLLPDGDLVAVALRGQVGEYVDETPEQLRIHLGQGITGWVAEHRVSQLLDNAGSDPRVLTIPGTAADVDESMLLAPMIYEDALLGVLVLSKLGLRQFTPDDLRLLEIYATFVAQAMAGADAAERLREQSATLARQLRSQQLLLQITESILTTLDPRRVLDQVARGLAALVRCDALAITEVDPSSGRLRSLVRTGPDPERAGPQDLSEPGGISAWVARENEPQLVPDVHQDPRAHASSDPGPERSLIVVPLRGRAGPIGVLTLERLDDRNRFGEEEFDLVKLFGAQVSIALQNAEEHREVEIRAETDALTGLRNKGTFDRQLTHAVDSGEPFSLLMVDLDDFKKVNDARGHQAGDDVLRQISRALRAAVRETDAVYRYGGDEFALLLPGTDARGAAAVADKVSRAVRLASATGVKSGTSCSIGIASCPDDGADGSRLLLAADRACYAAKRGGPGRIATAREGLALASEFALTSHTPVDDRCAVAS